RAMAAALDVSPAVAEDLLRRWAPAAALAPGQPAGRARWLAALDLPGDAVLDRLGVERAARRMEDVYAAEKFALVAPELREMARARLELAREAARALLRDLPEAPPQEAGAKGPGPVRRENPDLDGVFGG
ncbi:MAG: hypothetical protein HY721_32085, partial [Planctomycetes bacterium]|nr:hypothetical protein [Planctomycetota bacterium]